VRIKRALCEKFRTVQFFRLGLEHVNEQLSDGLAFDLRILNAIKRFEKNVGGIDMYERDVVALAEHRHDFLRFTSPHPSVTDQHTWQPVATRFMDQDRGNSRLHPAGYTANHAALAHLLANPLDRLRLEGAHSPIAG